MKTSTKLSLILGLTLSVTTTTLCHAGTGKTCPDAIVDRSAEEMFVDIFFMKNQMRNAQLPAFILDEIRTYENLDAAAKQGIQKKIDYVVQHVKSNRPGYFAKLKSAVLSKNHYEIKNTLIEGGNLISDASRAMEKISSRDSGIVIYGPAFDYTLAIIICYVLPMPPTYSNAGFTLDSYVNIVAATY